MFGNNDNFEFGANMNSGFGSSMDNNFENPLTTGNPMGNVIPSEGARNILNQEGFTQNAIEREQRELGTSFIKDLFGHI